MSTQVFDDTFPRANSSPGSPGNGWTDIKGNDWDIQSNNLRCVGTSGGQFTYGCQRPTGEVTQNGGKDQADVTYGTCLSTTGGAAGSGFAANLRQSGSAGTFNAYVCLVGFAGANMRIKTVLNGVQADLVSGSFAATINAPYALLFEAASTDSTHTNLTAKIFKTANNTTPLRTLTVTGDTNAAMQIAGTLGLSDPASQFDHSEFQAWNFDGTDPPITQAGVNQPVPVVSSTTQTSVTLTFAVATGGQSPYTQVLQRSTDPLFGTIATAATNPASPFTDTNLTPGTQYYYRIQSTDSSSPTPLVGTSPNCGAYTPLAATVAIAGIGDSTMFNQPQDYDNDLGLGATFPLILYNPLQIAGRYLEQVPAGLCNVIVINRAHPGLTSTDFAPAVTGLLPSAYTLVNGANSNVGTGQLLTDLTAILAQTNPAPGVVFIDNGLNDSRPGFRTSQAQYQLNVQGTANVFIGNGLKPMINFPGFVQDGSDQTHDPTSQSLIIQYIQAIQTIVANSNGAILLGDTKFQYQATNRPEWFEATVAALAPHNGVHPNGDGAYIKGMRWGRLAESVIFPPAPVHLAAAYPSSRFSIAGSGPGNAPPPAQSGIGAGTIGR